MSAHMVTDEHIHVLVWAAGHMSDHPAIGFNFVRSDGTMMTVNSREDRNELGQRLVDTNAASVATRYSEESPRYTYTHQSPQQIDWQPVELLKAINSYSYQACEVPGWHDTTAASFCDALQRALIHSLPGYDQAPWSL